MCNCLTAVLRPELPFEEALSSADHPELLNSRFAYVAVSRGSINAEIFTDSVEDLETRLGKGINKTAAINFGRILQPTSTPSIRHDTMMSIGTDIGIAI